MVLNNLAMLFLGKMSLFMTALFILYSSSVSYSMITNLDRFRNELLDALDSKATTDLKDLKQIVYKTS